MYTYRVTWEIDIEAEYAEQAARKALAIQRDAESIATVFTVKQPGIRPVTVDLCSDRAAS